MSSYTTTDQEKVGGPHPYRQQVRPSTPTKQPYPQSYTSEASKDFHSHMPPKIPNIPSSKLAPTHSPSTSGSTSAFDNAFQSVSSVTDTDRRTSSVVLGSTQAQTSEYSYNDVSQEKTLQGDCIAGSKEEISHDFVQPQVSHYSDISLLRYGSSSSLPNTAGDFEPSSRNFSAPISYRDRDLSSRSQSPASESRTLNPRRHERQSKSVDLSHLYLLDRNESAHFTLTNEHLSDQSQALIKQYLGENNALLPRMKTIEMYKANVKKSHDPKVLFQYAQYTLQTALTIDIPSDDNDKKKQVMEIKENFLKDAMRYLKKLSDKGYTDAQYLLGDAYSSGALGKVDNGQAFSLFQGAAKHGHIESAYRTAYCYEEGLGTSRDSRRAIDFLKFAASKNHPAAMFKLGIYSFTGKMGLSDNVNTKKTGINWLARAVSVANELTNAAPFELGKIHEHGFLDIIIPDRKYAYELYIQAASLGNIKAAAILGKAYEFGDQDNQELPENQKVIVQDASLSIHYYTQAAVGGDPECMLALCAWYLVGYDPALTKDETEGFLWALRAANMNYPKAQYTVGHLYEKGIGCDVNMFEAMAWYERAYNNGYKMAAKKLKQQKKLEQAIKSDSSSTKALDRAYADSGDTRSKIVPIEGNASANKKKKDCIIM